MIDKITKKLNDNEKLLDIFKSFGKEIKFSTGEIISSKKFLANQVFLIKNGNARLITEINGKLVSVLKLSKGNTIGIASLIGGKSIEEVRASEELIVYSIDDKKFLELYKKNLSLKNFCDNYIWEAEILSILKKFPKLNKKRFFLYTNLFDSLYEEINLINPDAFQINDCLKNNKRLFFNYFSDDYEIWSEIESLAQVEKLLQKNNNFPLRVVSVSKEIENIILKKINQIRKSNKNKFDENVDSSNISIPLKSNIYKTEGEKELYVPAKGHLEGTLACFEIISKIMNFPFKKESVKNSLKEYLINHKFISLQVCGEIASYHGLQINISNINPEMAHRIATPALIKWKNDFAVVSGINREGVEIIIPSEGHKNIKFEKLNNFFPNGIKILNLEKTNLTQIKVFGLNWFYPFLKKYQVVLLQILISGFVIQFLTLANPLLIQVIIDKVISQRSLDTLQVLGIALLIVTLFEGILSGFKSFLLSDTSNRIDKRISSEIIDHLLGLPLNYFQQRRTGELSSRIGELEKIRNFLTSQALTTILEGAFSIIYLAVMIAYSFRLTLISLTVLPVQILLAFICGPLFKKQFRNVAETNAKSQSHLIEILNGIETVKSQNYETKSKFKWQKLYERFINKSFEKTLTGTIFLQSSQVLQKISQILVLWFGASMVLQGYLSLGQLIAFRIISGYVTQPLLRLSNIWQEIQELKISFERLADIINTKEEINEVEKSKILMPKINGFIDFKNVHFKFSNKQNYLYRGLNLSVKPNNFVAIVGQSGSGKSTLMKLIYRLYSPNEGMISIDGYDISKVELKSLRNQIGIVPQEPLLFSGTIRDNIDLKGYETMEKEIIQASKIACAHDFIMKLPDGYSTFISEKGTTLSGGEKQRITIARTLLNNPRILILDEATSALDYATERRVYENLLNENRGSIFFVTHRLSIIKEANLILVFHRGRIDELGTHEELIEKKGRYYALLNQSQGM